MGVEYNPVSHPTIAEVNRYVLSREEAEPVGFLGESVGIRNAMIVILVAVLSTVLAAGSVSR